jgi:hypothetical protein
MKDKIKEFLNDTSNFNNIKHRANINFEEKKINVCFESESFGPVVEKMILILTNESDAFIDATKTGFEEEFAIDLKYALELITKYVRNA